MPCSRTQHGLTRVGLEPPTSGSGVRGINHQAIALPMLILNLSKKEERQEKRKIETFSEFLKSLKRTKLLSFKKNLNR